MRALMTFLAGLIITSGALASGSLKGHYGHYYATDYSDNTSSDVSLLCNLPAITGINYRMRWRDIEPTEGTFVWTAWDNVLTTIAGLGASTGSGGTYKAKNACKLWLFPEWKLFSVVGSSANPCPSWLLDSAGNPGIAPNDQANGSTTFALATGATAATNASPIVITTAAAHGFNNGDTVFVDLVAGNKAANGFWVVANKTTTTFQLTGSHGNGARVQSGTPTGWYGRVTKGASFDCKMWDSTVKAKFNAMLVAMGAHFDANANVEGFTLQESSLSMSAAGYSSAPSNGGTYLHTDYTTAIISYMNTCSTAFPTSRCLAFLNQIQTGGLADLRLISDALTALPFNQGCYSGPDILPNNSGLINGTYQALIDHVGCRSNSAQNTTIVGSGAGAVACAPNDCNAVFNFAVRGIFSQLGSSVPPIATEGLCINSYLFWNDSAAEQLKVNVTVTANPYGAGWYGLCVCGGGIP